MKLAQQQEEQAKNAEALKKLLDCELKKLNDEIQKDFDDLLKKDKQKQKK